LLALALTLTLSSGILVLLQDTDRPLSLVVSTGGCCVLLPRLLDPLPGLLRRGALQGLPSLHDLSVLDGALDNQALFPPVVSLQLEAIEVPESHQRPVVGRVLNEAIATALPGSALLGHLGALVALKDNLGLAHNTL